MKSLTIPLNIHYSNKECLSLSDVAESLLALERLVAYTPKALVRGTHLAPFKLRVRIDTIETGSLWEKLILDIVGEDNYNKFIAVVRKKFGLTRLDKLTEMQLSQIVSVFLVASISSGAFYAFTDNAAEHESSSSVGDGNTGKIVQITAQTLNITEAALDKVLERSILPQDVAVDAVRFIRPAKKDASAKITIAMPESSPIGVLSSSVIARVPEKFELPKREHYEDHEDVSIELKAADSEKFTVGWAAVVPSISGARVRLELNPAIKPDAVFGQRALVGDISAVYSNNKQGKRVLRKYILNRVDTED